MLSTVWATIREGKIELTEDVDVPDGTQALVTFLTPGDPFWLRVSERALDPIWDNPEDDVYEQLLEA
jgi:hypothetical protein